MQIENKKARKIMKDKIYIGLLGLGTVGFGVYKVLKMQQESMQQKLGCEVVIKKILVRNIEKAAKKLGDDSLLTNDFNASFKIKRT